MAAVIAITSSPAAEQAATPEAALAAVLDDEELMEQVAGLRRILARQGICIALAGIDGAGKTTLAVQLVTLLRAAGLEAERIQIYKWHPNLWHTPWVILANRYRRRRVLIFDRTVYDNVGRMILRLPRLRRWFARVAGLLRHCYPRFDGRIYLHATWEQIRVRRSKTERGWFVRLSNAYRDITQHASYTSFQSTSDTLRAVIEHVLQLV